VIGWEVLLDGGGRVYSTGLRYSCTNRSKAHVSSATVGRYIGYCAPLAPQCAQQLTLCLCKQAGLVESVYDPELEFVNTVHAAADLVCPPTAALGPARPYRTLR